MQVHHQSKPLPPSDSKPGFRWQVKTSDIDFMRDADARLAVDGCDCACLWTPLPRSLQVAPPSEQP